VPAAQDETLHAVIVAVSQLLADVPEIAELDINPLLVNPDGAIALDARLRLSATAPAGADHFAIRPYPAQWVESLDWQGRALVLRPIRPEDEAQHRRFLEQLDPEDLRMRIFYSRRHIERTELARLTQIDYDREVVFVAVAPDDDGVEQTLGTVRAVIDPDNIDAEFGIIVRSGLKGTGLGRVLMDKLVRTLRSHGTQRLVADVLSHNHRMRALARDMGFAERAHAHDAGTVFIELALQSDAPRADASALTDSVRGGAAN
jgi:acetyltransferase